MEHTVCLKVITGPEEIFACIQYGGHKCYPRGGTKIDVTDPHHLTTMVISIIIEGKAVRGGVAKNRVSWNFRPVRFNYEAKSEIQKKNSMEAA